MASTKIKLSDKCSRCPREQERVVTLEEAIDLAKKNANGGGSTKPAVEIFVHGEKLACYDFLCDSCMNTVCNYVEGASKPLSKKSSTPVRAKKNGGEVAQPPEKPKKS